MKSAAIWFVVGAVAGVAIAGLVMPSNGACCDLIAQAARDKAANKLGPTAVAIGDALGLWNLAPTALALGVSA